jgi:hypothetical protein
MVLVWGLVLLEAARRKLVPTVLELIGEVKILREVPEEGQTNINF